MKQKEVKKWVLIAFVCHILILMSYNYVSDAPYRWSRNLQQAIQSHDDQEAMQLIDEGIRQGYSLDTLSERASILWTFLEAVPQTPLQTACDEGNYLVAERLLQEGAAVRPVEGGSSREPLFCVLLRPYSSTDAELVQLLIDYGAALSYSDFELMLEAAKRSTRLPASESYDEKLAEGITEVFLILSEHSDCYVIDSAGRNALHYAALFENWILVETLVNQFYYPLDATDEWGNTAYDLAMENNAPARILEMLMIE